MPSLITPADFRLHHETDLGDPALQRLLDDADQAIVERYGPHSGNVTVDLEAVGGLLFLGRKASAIVSATEWVNRQDAAGVVLNAADYRTLDGGLVLERLETGPNGRSTWGERVVVVYAPDPSTARRVAAEIDLVKLAAVWEGKSSERSGDYAAELGDYERQRERILRRIRRGLPFA